MFYRMDTGLMSAQTGLAIVSTQLGLTANAPPDGTPHRISKKRPLGAEETKSEGAEADGCEAAPGVVRLGRALKEYHMLPSSSTIPEQLMDAMLNAADACKWQWPAGPDDVPLFAANLMKFAKAARLG